jgi:hypothetical protein
MFVNVPGAGHVAVVDRETKTVVDRWKTGDASANFPMALYEGGHRLFVGCRRPARLLVYDTDTGRILQSLECVGDADDIFVERFSDTPRVLVAGGEGFAEVYAQDLKGAYSRHSRVETAPGARTALLEEDQTTFHVAAPARDGKDARILVYRLLPPSFPAGGK